MDPDSLATPTDRNREDHSIVTVPAAPVFPPGRYGRRREPRRTPRWVPFALALVVAVGGLWLSLYLYGKYGSQYQPTVLASSVVSDTQVRVTVRLRKPDGRAADCRVQARDRHSAEVGYAVVRVAAGTDVTTSFTLATTGRAAVVDVLGCRAAPN